MSNHINIHKDIIPYTFNILLDNELFEMRIDYNNSFDLFSVTLLKDGIELCAGEPIIYGQPLFGDFKNRGNFPNVTITPIDESSEFDSVTFDNLSRTVLLIVTAGETNG